METPAAPAPAPAAEPPPLPASAGVAPRVPDYAGGAVSAMLKAPLWLVLRIEEGRDLGRTTGALLFWGLVCHAVFGAAAALYGGWPAAGMTAAKAPMIALGAFLLCLPSLYVFSCVGGMPLSLAQAAGLGACAVGMAGLLLLGLAPVAWLFAVSTSNLGFVVLLLLAAWLIAIGFVFHFFGHFRSTPSLARTAGLRWWVFVYVLVTLQMATTMRPLLARPADGGWWSAGKKPFVVHFFESLSGAPKAKPAAVTR
jgi:hypothetical protein